MFKNVVKNNFPNDILSKSLLVLSPLHIPCIWWESVVWLPCLQEFLGEGGDQADRNNNILA